MSTLIKMIILTILVSFKLEAQVEIPNGNFNQFEIIKTEIHTYSLPVGWKEHEKNNSRRQVDGQGFAYKYDVPDANGNALVLYREYYAQTNTIFTSFCIPENKENLRLVGRYKFSGSDIDTAKDTLRITVFSSENSIENTPETLPEDVTALNISTPKAQFEWFHIDINNIQKNNYITIVIQLISGSDDSYYWGHSNAVLDDLKFVDIKDLAQVN
ncbi:hypothetical protein [Aquimarina sp. Aq107]|uniref:hypothetical protein n=1 Tax=Aquimarina sp. Aq107 TaxID=1191912 RepID=UPI00131F2F53|nr:hypothetical protein [Aquimarina sp. Aq107]